MSGRIEDQVKAEIASRRLHPDDGYSYEECNGPSCRAIRDAAARAAAPSAEPGCPECGLVGAHNPRCASRWDVPTPDRVAGLREAAGRVLSWLGTCDQFDHHGNCQTHAIEKPCRVEALRAALLAEPVPETNLQTQNDKPITGEPVPGLDVRRG